MTNNLDRRLRQAASDLGLTYFQATQAAEQEWVERQVRARDLPRWVPHTLEAIASYRRQSLLQATAEARLQWTLKHETHVHLQEALHWS